MLHLFKSAAARAISLALISVLTTGLLIGAVRLALPFADLFHSQLENLLSETLGLELRVGRVGLRLAGLVPQLSLQDALLLDPQSGRPQLRLDQVRLDLNLVASLRQLSPQIETATLVGAHLVIRRLTDGSIAIAGLEAMEAGDPAALDFFFANGLFFLADSDLHWIDEKAGAPALHLSDVRILFENRDQRHRIGILARSSHDRQTHLRLVAEMRGAPTKPELWSGEIYLHWEGGDLDLILDGRLPAGLKLGSSSVALQSWNRLEAGRVTRSLSSIEAEGLGFGGENGPARSAQVRLDHLEAQLRWRGLGDGWLLEVKDLALTRGGARRPVSDLGIRFFEGSEDGWSIEGGNQYLQLADAWGLLLPLARLLPESLDPIRETRADGELRDLRLRIEHRAGLPPQWAASARLADLSLDAKGRFPGIQGISAKVAANQREGWLRLTSSDLTLDFPDLFPNPIKLDEAVGEIGWRLGPDGALQIGAREFVAANAEIATRTRFLLDLPAGGGDPWLDLQTELGDTDVSTVRHYVPSQRLKPKLAAWIDRAFVAGSISSGALLFRGSVADFPFDANQGRFEVLVGVENLILDFNQDWPRLEQVAGEVRFENRSLEISASAGRFLDSALADASVRIPDLRKVAAIEIRGTALGPFADALRVLGETPLREKFGALAGAMNAEGVSRLELDMAIPLRHEGRKGPLRLAGTIGWPGPAALSIAGAGIELTDLAGELRFSERDLRARSIEARLWDVPVRLGIDTLESGATTRIEAGGRFPVEIVAGQFPSRGWAYLEGRANLELRLDISVTSMGDSVPPIDFELTSDLAGISVALPAPLGKSAGEARGLSLSGRLIPDEPLRVRGVVGDIGINLGMARRGDGSLDLARGTFNLGEDPLPLREGTGLHLSGSMVSLELNPWLDWWASREGADASASDGGAGLQSANLHVQRLLLPDTSLNEVSLDLESRSKRWEAKLSARELEGQATIPHRSRAAPARISLDWLDLKGILDQEGSERGAIGEGRLADPRKAHTLDLSVERLLWGSNDLGRVSVRALADPDGLDFREVTLEGPFMSIRGRGGWRQSDSGPRSYLVLTVTGSDLGEFLRSLEFNSLIYKAPAVLDADLSWRGGPVQLSAADLEGRVVIDVGAGSLLEVEPGVGRMLGVLNLEALQRRLTLDFSDLFGRGFAFEKISGHLDIENGRATIEDLLIDGPSANVSIAGSANLVEQELDQIVTVTPRIGTGVAIASAVAGGPLVGAAVFIADRVSGGAVDKLGRHQYTVRGPWAEPEISRGRVGVDLGQVGDDGLFSGNARGTGTDGVSETKSRQAGAGVRPGEKDADARRDETGSESEVEENLFLQGH